MRAMSSKPAMIVMMATGILSMAAPISAQPQDAAPDPAKRDITVNGAPAPDLSQMTPGPEIKGFISARSGSKVQVTGIDGTKSAVTLTDATVIKASKGLFGSAKMDAGSLLNGLPCGFR